MTSRAFTRAVLASIVIASLFAVMGPRLAHAGQAGASPAAIITTGQAQAAEPQVLAEAAQYVGMGKVTRFPGAWCADFVNLILRATGRPPLPGRMASAALAYGPRVAHPRPGDIVVMHGHVGFVVADLGSEIEILSGNWSHRVARAFIPRRSVVAFIAV